MDPTPDLLTPVDVKDLANQIVLAWRKLWSETPHAASVFVLLSQWALETGWGKACHNYNLGNIKSREGDGYPYQYFRCNEVINGKTVWFDPPDPSCRFRAYNSLYEGVIDWLGLLRRRFNASWPAVVNGDPAGFARLLKQQGYYTANEAQYEHTLVSIFANMRMHIGPSWSPHDCDAPVLTEDEKKRINGLISLTVKQMIDEIGHDGSTF